MQGSSVGIGAYRVGLRYGAFRPSDLRLRNRGTEVYGAMQGSDPIPSESPSENSSYTIPQIPLLIIQAPVMNPYNTKYWQKPQGTLLFPPKQTSKPI